MTSAERAVDPAVRLQDALDAAYRYLGFRDRTVAEVRRHLQRRRVEPDTIDQAVGELRRQGYLDDARFARRFTEDRRTLDAWGNDRIERRLRALGVEPDDVARALTDGEEGSSELDAAVALLLRRFRAPPSDDRERERALGVLARKGYELELAYAAVRAWEQRVSEAAA